MFDPSPRADVAAPDDDDPDPAVWEEARRAFAAGASLPVVAERFGLSLRTVQRRALAQGWRGDRAASCPHAAGWAEPGDGAERGAVREADLAPFAEAHAFEVGQLLMETTPDLLARFALRKAGEAAAADRPAAAQAWLRVINGVLRAAPRLDRLSRPFNEADHMRALYAAALRGEGPAPEAGPAVVSRVVSPQSHGGDTAGGWEQEPPRQKSRSS